MVIFRKEDLWRAQNVNATARITTQRRLMAMTENGALFAIIFSFRWTAKMITRRKKMSEEEIYDMIHQEMSNHYFDMHKHGRESELRDMFAAAALTGLVNRLSPSIEADASEAYRISDEMLKARKNTG